ncbi:hypothetical protein [Paraburkholderia fungorum]|uniref:hypothetical protein n=1 Tax=Paraburkholderia fungorum TaxID=134537 RepID=UPI001C1ED0FA|nr:hypothetical protein [Paraburkholderia fungorum]MBU7437007.1 hypothetical protein [Paraburkholderia fungorum]
MGNYYFDDAPERRNLRIEPADLVEFNGSLASDIRRYASAAIESLDRIVAHPDQPHAAAWCLIRAYYASYFAANVLMRLSGSFCTNLATEEIGQIKATASLYGVPAPVGNKKRNLSSGVYYGGMSPINRSTTLVLKSMDGVTGGVHKQFWAGFHEWLERCHRDIKLCSLSSQEQKQAQAEYKVVSGALCYESHSNGHWLSEFRNAVNYRLEHGVWHPYENNLWNMDRLLQIARDAIATPEVTRINSARALSQVERAMETCCLLVGWMLSSVSLLEQSAGSRRHFLNGLPSVNI